MLGTRDAYRRRQARRSTLAGVGGVVFIAIGVILTLAEVGGNMLPTILALAGVGALIVGCATGALLVFENFRFHQGQSYYDDDEEEDE